MAAAARRPATTRKDPAKRPLGGPAASLVILNKDPRFRYVYVAKGHEQEYMYLGYELSRYVEGESKPVGFKGKPGDIMEVMGNYLMQIPLEDYEADQAEQQAEFNALDRQRARDLQMGKPIQGIRFHDESSETTEEFH